MVDFLKKPVRITRGRAALPTARVPPWALVDEAEPFQLFLERGRQDAERFGGAFLIAIGGQKDREDQIPLEAQEHVAKNQTLSARGCEVRGGVVEGWFREMARH